MGVWANHLFGFRGRMTRMRFATTLAGWAVYGVVVYYVFLLPVLDLYATMDRVFYTVFSIPPALGVFSAMVRRLHDFGASGAWAVLIFALPVVFWSFASVYLLLGLIAPSEFLSYVAPLLNLGALTPALCVLGLLLMPGTKRGNRYGPVPGR